MTQALIGLVPVIVAAGIVLTVADQALQKKAARGEPLRLVSKKKSKYTANTKISGQACYNCQFFLADEEKCEIVKGKISRRGWSKFWIEER